MCACCMEARWPALIIHTRTSAFAGMPPRRNARSPPRVQPQHDQDADIREIWDGLNELETDQAEEIRLIRDRLNTLEKKHDEHAGKAILWADLLRMLCFMVYAHYTMSILFTPRRPRRAAAAFLYNISWAEYVFNAFAAAVLLVLPAFLVGRSRVSLSVCLSVCALFRLFCLHVN